MIVFSLTDCPPKIRGDLTKWLCEVNTGVYVGKVNARVREELWKRVCENLTHGKATMVYSANNEQGFEFRVHHTTWSPVDFEGITLMMRPNPMNSSGERIEAGMESKAAQRLKTRKIQAARAKKKREQGFVVVDLETSGLSPDRDEIIEIGALHVVENEAEDSYCALVQCEKTVPESIRKLTGITKKMQKEEGRPLSEVLSEFAAFIGEKPLVLHHAAFDLAFLRDACKKCAMPEILNDYTDTMILAKRKLDDVENYKLETLAEYFSFNRKQNHRALDDCKMMWFVFRKLNEI